MPLDRRAQRLLDMLAATDGRVPSNAGERRAALASLARSADDDTTLVRIQDQRIPGPAGPIPIRIYAPLEVTIGPAPALVFFHGGGWVAGGLETHDGLCRRLCEASACQIIAVDYRLAPEHPFPAGLTDCLMAVNWVAHHASALGIDPWRIGVGGDSAGAALAAAVTQIARDAAGPNLALQVLICPILDVGRRTGSRAAFCNGYFISQSAFERDLADYAPGVALDDPRLSPAHAANLERLPHALIHTAEFDPFRDEGEAYAEALGLAGMPVTGVRHPGMIHYFYAMARAIPYAEAAAAVIGSQMRAAFSDPVAQAPVGAAITATALQAR